MNYSWAITTYRSLPYLKLAIKSIRENAFYKNRPIIVYTENDAETANWLVQQSDITPIIEYNEVPVGIGGGINKIVEQCKTEFVSLLHSDMYISRHYDKPLYDIVAEYDVPILASAWRIEPDIWNQPSRFGTLMAPIDLFGMYHNDFKSNDFLEMTDKLINSGGLKWFRKAEGVSYMIRTKYFIPNDPLFAPSSYEDMDQFIRMQKLGYDFIVPGNALVWHFGARSSHFLGQHDKLIGKSDRQKKCEEANAKKWIQKYGKLPEFDDVGFVRI